MNLKKINKKLHKMEKKSKREVRETVKTLIDIVAATQEGAEIEINIRYPDPANVTVGNVQDGTPAARIVETANELIDQGRAEASEGM